MNRSWRWLSIVVILLLLLIQVAPVQADGITHVVQRGETLFRIGLRYGVSVAALRTANRISGNMIYAGQILVIPTANNAAAPAADAVTQPAAAPANGVHIVQRGESLYLIGRKYGVSVSALQSANQLRGATIYPGQRLTIPGASAPPAVSAASSTGAVPAPAGGGKRFLVDLSEQTLYAFEGDTLVRSTLISSGQWPTVTVTGTFYIYLRYSSQRMRGPGYDLPGVPYVMYFYKGYALHGTYWHNNFGVPMSHGCINMPTPEAEWAFNWAAIGTPVTVQV